MHREANGVAVIPADGAEVDFAGVQALLRRTIGDLEGAGEAGPARRSVKVLSQDSSLVPEVQE